MSEIVYILTNESMPGIVRIGTISQQCIEELCHLHIGIPLPYQCPYAAEVDSAEYVKNRLYEEFASDRINPERAFFKTEPDRVIDLLETFEIADQTEAVQEALDTDISSDEKTTIPPFKRDQEFDDCVSEVESLISLIEEDVTKEREEEPTDERKRRMKSLRSVLVSGLAITSGMSKKDVENVYAQVRKDCREQCAMNDEAIDENIIEPTLKYQYDNCKLFCLLRALINQCRLQIESDDYDSELMTERLRNVFFTLCGDERAIEGASPIKIINELQTPIILSFHSQESSTAEFLYNRLVKACSILSQKNADELKEHLTTITFI